MGSSDEQFCLKWNDFQQCIKSTFQDLREESDFMDVTLSCDGEQIRAHKVILSACSVTFKNLLKKNPSQNPVILLWDVSPRDLSAILDFMYNGEVNVKQEHLNSFLSVAEKLRVRGLCQSDSKSSPSRDNKSKSARASDANSDALQPSSKRAKFAAEENDIQEIPVNAPPVKQEKVDAAVAPATPVPPTVYGGGAEGGSMMVVKDFPVDYAEAEDYGEYYEDEANYGVDPVDQTQTGKDCAEWNCNLCGKSYGTRASLYFHRSTKHRDLCRKYSKYS